MRSALYARVAHRLAATGLAIADLIGSTSPSGPRPGGAARTLRRTFERGQSSLGSGWPAPLRESRTALNGDQLADRPLPDEVLTPFYTQPDTNGPFASIYRPHHLRLDRRSLLGEVEQDDITYLEPLYGVLHRHRTSLNVRWLIEDESQAGRDSTDASQTRRRDTTAPRGRGGVHLGPTAARPVPSLCARRRDISATIDHAAAPVEHHRRLGPQRHDDTA